MTDDQELIALDLRFNWHPCSQMHDYENFKPLIIKSAQGNFIELSNGQKIIDAVSSWWCKILGHQDPRLKAALLRQADRFEHVIFANTTHESIVHLSERLARLLPPLDKVLYASDGSCAVEIALKMSLHSRLLLGQPSRTKFISLKNAYHGETTGAMSVSDLGIYRDPYKTILFDSVQINDIPYVNSVSDPLWKDCSHHWPVVEKQLAPYADTATALIVEPIVQCAAGMKIYSADFLKRLSQWCKQNQVHLIADEIAVGIGITGKMLACDHANIVPDFICLGKNLTSGWLPLSIVLTSNELYQLFYHPYDPLKSFLHSHTFSGNALATAVALETLTILQNENIPERANLLGNTMFQAMSEVAAKTQRLNNVRQIGFIVAADLINPDSKHRLGYEVFQQAVKRGALLRPLGNTIYWWLPMNTELTVVDALKEITIEAIMSV